MTIDAYDFKGNALHTGRTLLADVDTPVDWAALEGLDTLAGLDAAAASLLETDATASPRCTTRTTGSAGRSRPTEA